MVLILFFSQPRDEVPVPFECPADLDDASNVHINSGAVLDLIPGVTDTIRFPFIGNFDGNVNPVVGGRGFGQPALLRLAEAEVIAILDGGWWM